MTATEAEEQVRELEARASELLLNCGCAQLPGHSHGCRSAAFDVQNDAAVLRGLVQVYRTSWVVHARVPATVVADLEERLARLSRFREW